jgi:hypothetical protein
MKLQNDWRVLAIDVSAAIEAIGYDYIVSP